MHITISNELFQKIIYNSFGYNRETGGFLGLYNNAIVEYLFDEGMETSGACTYRPNVIMFNEFIKMCSQKGIEKYGILHTHLNEEGTLSNDDRVFIKNIFEVNNRIVEMYFPVVIPGKTMRIYKGNRTMEGIKIEGCIISLKDDSTTGL